MNNNNPINNYQLANIDKIEKFINILNQNNIKYVEINTEYPGGYYYVYLVKEKNLKIFSINNDNYKITDEEQTKYLENILFNIDLKKYFIKENKSIRFYDFFISLENLRDITENIINTLIEDNSTIYEHNKIGGFGFIPGYHPKPFRTNFIKLTEKHPDKLIYIETKKYNKNDPSLLSWINIKRKFKYIIDLPGHTYSTKLYTLLFCKRLIFLVGEKRNCMFNWEYKLIPYQHFIPIKEDYSDLIEKYDWCESNPQDVEKIIKNAYDFVMKEMHPNIIKKLIIDNIFDIRNDLI
jgi:hypothetical protein